MKYTGPKYACIGGRGHGITVGGKEHDIYVHCWNTIYTCTVGGKEHDIWGQGTRYTRALLGSRNTIYTCTIGGKEHDIHVHC